MAILTTVSEHFFRWTCAFFYGKFNPKTEIPIFIQIVSLYIDLKNISYYKCVLFEQLKKYRLPDSKI